MRKIVNVGLILLIAGIGAAYVFLGPSVFFGGPSKAEIIRVTRATMVANAASPEDDQMAQKAKISPQGFCSKTDTGAFACIVDVTVDGAEVGSFISVLKKADDGSWVAVEG